MVPPPSADIERFCDVVSIAMIASGVVTFLALTVGGKVAQYGRHGAEEAAEGTNASTSRRRQERQQRRRLSSFFSFPSHLPARLAWFTQELPAFTLAPLAFYVTCKSLEVEKQEEEKARRRASWFPLLPASPTTTAAATATAAAPLPNKLLLLAFALHYCWRSLFYPLLIRGGKKTRALEWALALLFCVWNGVLQGSAAALAGRRNRRRGSWRRLGGSRGERGNVSPSPSPPLLPSVLFALSLAAWALFWAINLAADAHLRSLRKKKKNSTKKGKKKRNETATRTTTMATATTTREAEADEEQEEEKRGQEEEDSGYRLPTSRLFSLVACPNYGAECAEWLSFAAASASLAAAGVVGAVGENGGSGGSGRSVGWKDSLPSLAFALFTASNLVPRALAHRRWYIEKFEGFPREKRAIIPFVL